MKNIYFSHGPGTEVLSAGNFGLYGGRFMGFSASVRQGDGALVCPSEKVPVFCLTLNPTVET